MRTYQSFLGRNCLNALDRSIPTRDYLSCCQERAQEMPQFSWQRLPTPSYEKWSTLKEREIPP